MENDEWFDQLPLGPIDSWRPVSGGDINEAYQLVAQGKTYFIKVQPNQAASYFAHEQRGLQELNKVIATPHPIANGQIDGDAYLVLNWIDEGNGAQADLGRAVAKMHQQHHDQFGFYTSHHTKALFKDNHFNDDWVDYYVNQRLMPEHATVQKLGRWNDWRESHFQNMVNQFEQYYRQNPPIASLCHGDLWAGNFMFASDGTPTLIDPDALYGDREYDLAMTTIFGGFSQDFYTAYNEDYPLKAGFENRLPWYQFYYLCMHLILFGASYGPSVDRILSQY